LVQLFRQLKQNYRARTERRLCLYDEIADLNPGGTLPWAQLEQLCRQLKRNYEEQRDYERAGDFHYGEKEMRRQNPETSRGHKTLLRLYRVISGYGERIWKPLVVAVGVWVLFALVYLWWGLHPAPQNSGASPLMFKCSSLTLNCITNAPWCEAFEYSLEVMTLQRPKDFALSGLGITALYTLQSFIGPLLLGLAALAVRQRLKR
jgi:hypothetical protein